jgi:hypothetical protein
MYNNNNNNNKIKDNYALEWKYRGRNKFKEMSKNNSISLESGRLLDI